MKELILKGAFDGIWKLMSFTVLEVPAEVLSSIAQTVAAIERVGVRIGWMTESLGTYSDKTT